MDYLEELKQRVAEAFENASEKADIDNLSAINASIKMVEAEHDQLMAKNKELIAAYKDAVTHPGISGKEDKNMDPTNVPESPKMLDFADFIAQNMPKL